MRALGYRGEQHAVTKAEAALMVRPDGTSPKKLNRWVRDGEPETPAETADEDFPTEVPF
jgi:hypothetical protein